MQILRASTASALQCSSILTNRTPSLSDLFLVSRKRAALRQVFLYSHCEYSAQHWKLPWSFQGRLHALFDCGRSISGCLRLGGRGAVLATGGMPLFGRGKNGTLG